MHELSRCLKPVAALLFILSCSLAAAASGAHADEQKVVKIGVSAPLSGGASTYGEDIKNSLEFANNKIAGGKYDLIFEDDRCTGKDATVVAHKLMEIDHVDYVTGFGCSGAILSAAPVYEQAKTVVVAVAPTSPKVTQAGDYIFRVCPSDKGGAKVLFNTVAAKVKKVGILSEETDFPQNFAQAFAGYNQPERISIVQESYLPGTDDFRAVLLKFRSRGVDGMFLNTQAESTLIILVKQMREMGWDVPRFAVYWPSAPSFLRAVGDAAEGIIFVDTPGNESILDPQGRSFFEEFKTKYGELNSGDWHFYLSVAALQVLDQGIRSGAEMKDYLYHNKFNTIVGTLSFDENGDVIGIEHVMKTIKNGKPALLNRK